METQYNFQVRKAGVRTDWEDIAPIHRNYLERVTALHFAKRLARIFPNAEIRLTEGEDPHTTSGTYIRDDND